MNRSLRWDDWLFGKLNRDSKRGMNVSNKYKADLINSISDAEYEQYKSEWNRFNAGNNASGNSSLKR